MQHGPGAGKPSPLPSLPSRAPPHAAWMAVLFWVMAAVAEDFLVPALEVGAALHVHAMHRAVDAAVAACLRALLAQWHCVCLGAASGWGWSAAAGQLLQHSTGAAQRPPSFCRSQLAVSGVLAAHGAGRGG